MRLFLVLPTVLLVLGASTLCAQQVPTAITTDPPADKSHPAAFETMPLPSHGSQLNALLYVAAGPGPHPAVILLHGFPGNERNLDLAQAIRRAGWNVIYFNYRGSWGSPGDYSFTHATEDVAAALAYLRDPANAAKLRTDPKRIVLIGHSLGGFLAAYGAAHDPAAMATGMISAVNLGSWASSVDPEKDYKQAASKIAESLAQEGMAPLSGCTPQSLAGEMLDHRAEWDFDKYSASLAARPLLLITSDDGLADFANSLAAASGRAGNKHITAQHLAADHSYSDKRIALETAVLDWLASLL